MIVANVTYCLPVWGSCSQALFGDIAKLHTEDVRLLFTTESECQWQLPGSLDSKSCSLAWHSSYVQEETGCRNV